MKVAEKKSAKMRNAILALILIFGLLVTGNILPIVTRAEEMPSISYVDENGDTQYVTNYTLVASSSENYVKWSSGWYVVDGEVTINGTIKCDGDIKIILKDGCTFNINAPGYFGCLWVLPDSKLTIHGQQLSTGTLNAKGGEWDSGIGGAYGYACGTIIINGGVINAKGGEYSAGIGAGYGGEDSTLSTSNITINGGTVTAIGGNSAAGIGGAGSYKMGGNGKNITINGGNVTAIGGTYAAGIGGGCGGNGENISIYDGTITTIGGSDGAGIGGGCSGNGSSISIYDGNITTTGGDNAAGIGGGSDGGADSINIYYGSVTSNGGKNGAGIGGGYDGNGENITIYDGYVITNGNTYGAGIGGGSRGVAKNITIYDGYIEATGGSDNGDGIGNSAILLGDKISSQIYVAKKLPIYAGYSENPTDKIATEREDNTDIGEDFRSRRYVVIVGDTVLYTAKFINKDGTIYKKISVLEGMQINKPEDPADIENYTFVGWSQTDDEYIPFNFSYRFNDDQSLYAYYFVDYVQPSIENNYTVSVPEGIENVSYQWYKANVSKEMDLFYFDEEAWGFPTDSTYLDYLYLLYGTAANYERRLNSELDDSGDLPDGETYKHAIQMYLNLADVNSCVFEFTYYGDEILTNDCTKQNIYDASTGETITLDFGTIEIIDKNRYRLTSSQVDGGYSFYLALDDAFEIKNVMCYYVCDVLRDGFTNAKFGGDFINSFDAGQYFCKIYIDDSYAGKTNNINAYNAYVHFDNHFKNAEMFAVMLEGSAIGNIVLQSILDGVTFTKWQYLKNGTLYDVDENLYLTEDIDFYPIYTLEEKNFTNALVDTFESHDYFYYHTLNIPTGKYILTEDIVLGDNETLGVSPDSVVEIYLNGHIIQCNQHAGIVNMGSLKVYGGEVQQEYYFDFSSEDWHLISNPSQEQKDSAILLDAYDPFTAKNASSKVIKVIGNGLITNAYGYTIRNEGGNSYYENVLFIGNYSTSNSSVISTSGSISIYLKNCEFYGNKSENCGGVVWACGDLTFDSCILKYNYAGAFGGGIYVTDTTVKVKGNTIVAKNVENHTGSLKLSNYMLNMHYGTLFAEDDFCGSIGVSLGFSDFGYANSDKSKYFIPDDEDFITVTEYDEDKNVYKLSCRRVYEVRFVTYDENVIIEPLYVPYETYIDAPKAIPQKDGYTFVGWSESDDYMYEFDFENDCIYRDLTLYAMFELQFDEPTKDNDYTVVVKNKDANVKYQWYMENVKTEISMGDEKFENFLNLYSGSFENGVVTAKEGYEYYEICIYGYYIYEGSYIDFTYLGDEELTADVLSEDWGYMVFNSGTLTSLGNNRYRLYFNVDMDDDGYCQLFIHFNHTFTISDVVVVLYTDVVLEDKTSASLGKVTQTGTYFCEINYDEYFYIYSKEINVYSVKTYENKNAETYNDILVYQGQNLYSILGSLSKDHYNFLGWYYVEEDTEKKLDSEYIVTGNCSFYAKWEVQSFTVKFVNEDQTLISSKEYLYGEAVTQPSTPIKQSDEQYNYVFDGWDKEVVNCTQDVTYTAKYKQEVRAEYTSNQLLKELTSAVEAITTVDLSTYSTIVSIQERADELLESDKMKLNEKLQPILTQYENYVKAINAEYEVAKEVESKYFVTILAMMNYLTIFAYAITKGKRWF